MTLQNYGIGKRFLTSKTPKRKSKESKQRIMLHVTDKVIDSIALVAFNKNP